MLMETTPTDNMSATLYDIVALVKRSEIEIGRAHV